MGDTVTWLGLSGSSSTEVVHIKQIMRQRGTPVFPKPVLPGTGNPKKVVGTITNKTEEFIFKDESFSRDYKYKLQFTINDHDHVYPIDPKIQVNQ